MVVATELRIADRLELQLTKTRVADEQFFTDNPLAKVPVLITCDGQALVDSKLICEYLNREFGEGRLLPEGNGRWQALSWIYLADGIVDAALLAIREDMRECGPENEDAKRFQLEKVTRGLDWFENSPVLSVPTFGLKDITLGCALEYLGRRFGDAFTFKDRPRLHAWFSKIQSQPSFVNSAFP